MVCGNLSKRRSPPGMRRFGERVEYSDSSPARAAYRTTQAKRPPLQSGRYLVQVQGPHQETCTPIKAHPIQSHGQMVASHSPLSTSTRDNRTVRR